MRFASWHSGAHARSSSQERKGSRDGLVALAGAGEAIWTDSSLEMDCPTDGSGAATPEVVVTWSLLVDMEFATVQVSMTSRVWAGRPDLRRGYVV